MSPNKVKPIGFLEAGLLARQRAGYDSTFESQFGGNGNYMDSQEQSVEENAMVIKINDPTAEATKARLLAGIRILNLNQNTGSGSGQSV